MVPRRPPRSLLLDCPAGWRVPDRPALTADPVLDCKSPGVRSIETPPG